MNEVAGHSGSCDSHILPCGPPFVPSPCFGSFGRSQVNPHRGLLPRSNISCGVELTVSRNIHACSIGWKRLRKVLLKPLWVGYWSEWTSISPRQEPPKINFSCKILKGFSLWPMPHSTHHWAQFPEIIHLSEVQGDWVHLHQMCAVSPVTTWG